MSLSSLRPGPSRPHEPAFRSPIRIRSRLNSGKRLSVSAQPKPNSAVHAPAISSAALTDSIVSGRNSSSSRIRLRATTASAVSRSEEHTSELQSLMRISYAVFCLKKKHNTPPQHANKHDKHHE